MTMNAFLHWINQNQTWKVTKDTTGKTTNQNKTVNNNVAAQAQQSENIRKYRELHLTPWFAGTQLQKQTILQTREPRL